MGFEYRSLGVSVTAKSRALLALASALAVCVSAAAMATTPAALTAAKSTDTVVCTQSDGLSVHNEEDFDDILFSAERGEKLEIEPSRGTTSHLVNGEQMKFVYAHLPERDGDDDRSSTDSAEDSETVLHSGAASGWVAQAYVAVKSECAFEPDRTTTDQDEPVDSAALARPKNCNVVQGFPTFYNPVSAGIEGGPRNRHGEPIITVEKATSHGFPVTIAADYTGTFGAHCNSQSPDRRCVILIHAPTFDAIFPAYRKKFAHLPKDTFVGIIEDSGAKKYFVNGAKNSAGHHIDVATDRRDLGLHGSPGFSSMSWVELASRCEQGASARSCDFSKLVLDANTQNRNCWPMVMSPAASQATR